LEKVEGEGSLDLTGTPLMLLIGAGFCRSRRTHEQRESVCRPSDPYKGLEREAERERRTPFGLFSMFPLRQPLESIGPSVHYGS
jgi:hypothetical protein